MKSVLCLTKYSSKGASSRIRILSNVEFYRSKGYIFDVAPLLCDDYLVALYSGNKTKANLIFFKCIIARLFHLFTLFFSGKKYDLIYIEYEILPYMPWFMESFFYSIGRQSIVELDDPIYLKYDKINFLRNKYSFISSNVSAIVVSSSVMKNYILKLNEDLFVKVLDTPVDFFHSIRQLRRDNIIGWIGSPTSQFYLLNILPKIIPVIKKFGWKLEVVGVSKNFLDLVESDFHDFVKITEWHDGIDSIVLPTWRIGLLPLDSSAWTHARDCYKAHMYLSMGVFSICSNIPSTSEFKIRYGYCSLVNEAGDWGDILSESLILIESQPDFFNPIEKYLFRRDYYAQSIVELMNTVTNC